MSIFSDLYLHLTENCQLPLKVIFYFVPWLAAWDRFDQTCVGHNLMPDTIHKENKWKSYWRISCTRRLTQITPPLSICPPVCMSIYMSIMLPCIGLLKQVLWGTLFFFLFIFTYTKPGIKSPMPKIHFRCIQIKTNHLGMGTAVRSKLEIRQSQQIIIYPMKSTSVKSVA